MRPSTTARRYAEAAFDVAAADGQTDTWLTELQGAVGVYERDDVSGYFEDPHVPREEKLQTLPQLFPYGTQRVLNLLRLLATKQRMYLLPPIASEFERLVREARG